MLVLIQTLLTGCAVLMSLWARVPWLGTLALGCLGASAMAAELAPAARRRQFCRWSLAAAWVCTLVVPASWLLAGNGDFTLERYWDYYYAVLAWLTAAAILPESRRVVGAALKTLWTVPVVIWAFFGDLLWLATAYSENHSAAFYAGLLCGAILLLFCKSRFGLTWSGIQVVNTLLVLTVGLPLADLVKRGINHHGGATENHPEVLKRYCTYNAAREDPAAFERWWNYFWGQWTVVEKAVMINDHNSPTPFRLRPNSQAVFVENRIAINSKGFRGKEIPAAKGAAYRIVALGESTTFGFTVGAEDKPWPELLEQMIRDRLKPARPVEVINAGIPKATLPQNLCRFPEEILPLQPDMLISYHGINGFYLLDSAIPQTTGKLPPHYRKRPLTLLADCEYRWKLMRYRQRQTSSLFLHPPTFANLMENDYARGYRQLIDIAKTNRFRLVLSSYSMAVNEHSSPEAFDFFRSIYPAVVGNIKANLAHSLMVQQLIRQYPEVGFVDTQPQLDGDTEKFEDLIHFTQAGDRQVAEAFFAGIRKTLEEDLARPMTP